MVPETSVPPPTAAQRSNVYVFGASSFLNDTASEMAYWVLPAFLASIGVGPEKLGVIEGNRRRRSWGKSSASMRV